MKKTLVLALILLIASASAATASNDPGYPQQWGPRVIGAPDAWPFSSGASVIVAVIDTGADLDHEDLVGQLVTGVNVTRDERGAPPNDSDSGHGTHVSGIIAAKTGNAVGIAGIAHSAKLMPIRALKKYSDCSSACGYTEDIIEGIKWGVDNGAKVVNLSLGDDVALRTLFGSAIEDGLEYAWSKGAIPIIASGNDNVGLLVPSGYGATNAIVVGSTDSDDTQSSFSNDVGDAKWGMVAPGGAILSTYKSNQYATISGTSMSTPHIAAAAAILFSQGLSQMQVVDRLLSTSKDLGAAGRDRAYGFGRLDLSAAVIRPAGSPPKPPPVSGGSTSREVGSQPPAGPKSRGASGPDPGSVSDPLQDLVGTDVSSGDQSPSETALTEPRAVAVDARADEKNSSSNKLPIVFGLLTALSALGALGFGATRLLAARR